MIQRITILLLLWCAAVSVLPLAFADRELFARQDICEDALSKGYVVVVAGYSSGADIAPALMERGVRSIIHVQPSPTGEIAPLLMNSFNAHHYRENIIFDGDYNALLSRLRSIPIAAIIAGTETGVALTDFLTENLNLPGNGTQFSEAKRNKFLMHRRLKEAGVPSLPDILSGNLAEIQAWIDDPQGNAGQWPVVIKPVDSAATEGVHICSDQAEVAQAFHSLMGRRTLLGSTIHEVLAQSFLAGTEFVVNTVTRDGKTVVGEIWKYHKRKIRRPEGGLSNIYLYDELMDFDGPEAKILTPYVEKVLAALNIVNGPAHAEIMMTPRGPILVEVGARLMGGHTHIATRKAVGISPLDLVVMAMLEPDRFDAIYRAGPLKRHMHVRKLELESNVAGTLTAVNHVDTIKKLKTLWAPNGEGLSFPKPGHTIARTIDLLTSAGCLWLMGASEQQVEQDYQTIVKLQPTMFEVSAGAP